MIFSDDTKLVFNRPVRGRLDLEGQRFGRLLVLRRNPRKSKNSSWDCQCDCGRLVRVERPNLTAGTTQSCGCLRRELNINLQRERRTTHGNARRPIFIRWKAIISRTTNPKDKNYSRYGGRGINIDSRWLEFDNFLQDMGDPPSLQHSIERIDNNGPYSKENCRWATRKEQCLNRRTNRRLTAFGRTQTISEWAEETGLHFNCIDKRLKRGWEPERAVTRAAK